MEVSLLNKLKCVKVFVFIWYHSEISTSSV